MVSFDSVCCRKLGASCVKLIFLLCSLLRYLPHVHFQLSIHPPESHDMPGVVSMEDRPRALIHYPDPRQVLGPLY
jgi:hypothetical protein